MFQQATARGGGQWETALGARADPLSPTAGLAVNPPVVSVHQPPSSPVFCDWLVNCEESIGTHEPTTTTIKNVNQSNIVFPLPLPGMMMSSFSRPGRPRVWSPRYPGEQCRRQHPRASRHHRRVSPRRVGPTVGRGFDGLVFCYAKVFAQKRVMTILPPFLGFCCRIGRRGIVESRVLDG